MWNRGIKVLPTLSFFFVLCVREIHLWTLKFVGVFFFYFVSLITGILRLFLKLGFSAPYNIPLLPTVSHTRLGRWRKFKSYFIVIHI